MAQSVRELRDKFIAVRSDILNIVGDAMKDNEDSVTGYNKSQLYYEGIDKTGSPITPPYSRNTTAIKRKKGQPDDRVTLRDTGKFYRDMYVDVKGESYQIYSRDSKTSDLIKKYGEDIFGLTSENKRALWIGVIRGAVVRIIASRTGVKVG